MSVGKLGRRSSRLHTGQKVCTWPVRNPRLKPGACVNTSEPDQIQANACVRGERRDTLGCTASCRLCDGEGNRAMGERSAVPIQTSRSHCRGHHDPAREAHGEHPLTPDHPGRARILLSSGTAAVCTRDPFPIIVNVAVEHPTLASLRLTRDPGSHTTGRAVSNDATGEGLVAAERRHRGRTITARLDTRRAI
jgi:hypothetical protein